MVDDWIFLEFSRVRLKVQPHQEAGESENSEIGAFIHLPARLTFDRLTNRAQDFRYIQTGLAFGQRV